MKAEVRALIESTLCLLHVKDRRLDWETENVIRRLLAQVRENNPGEVVVYVNGGTRRITS